MTLREQLLKVADTYCTLKGLKMATVSTSALGGGRVLERIAAGGGMEIDNFEKAMRWFSLNWPADAPWPAGIARPATATPAVPA